MRVIVLYYFQLIIYHAYELFVLFFCDEKTRSPKQLLFLIPLSFRIMIFVDVRRTVYVHVKMIKMFFFILKMY